MGCWFPRLADPASSPTNRRVFGWPWGIPIATRLNFKRDSGEALYRRSLYTFWKRTAPPPTLVTLDAPSRENCTVRRSRTNTPLAALALMNDEQFVEASRHMAQRIMTEGGLGDGQRASYAFRLATSRLPSDAELKVLLDVYRAALARFQADKKPLKTGFRRRIETEAKRSTSVNWPPGRWWPI